MQARLPVMISLMSQSFRSALINIVASALLTLSMAACGEGGSRVDDSLDDDAGTGDAACVDEDGDGRGELCDDGPDCDDSDDTIFEDCNICTAVAKGCACEDGTAPVACELTKEEMANDPLLCKTGQRYCRQGQWTGCKGIATFAQ